VQVDQTNFDNYFPEKKKIFTKIANYFPDEKNISN